MPYALDNFWSFMTIFVITIKSLVFNELDSYSWWTDSIQLHVLVMGYLT